METSIRDIKTVLLLSVDRFKSNRDEMFFYGYADLQLFLG